MCGLDMTDPSSKDGRADDWGPAVALSALLIVVAMMYARVLGFGLLEPFDDGLYVLNRPEVRDWWSATWHSRLLTPETGYPVPVPTFLYAHARLLAPETYPALLHGLNVAIHLANIILVFALMRRWEGRWVAVAVAAVWGLHPAAVEGVAWMTNLKTCLWLTFLLGAMLLWERRLDRGDDGESSPGLTTGVAALYLLGLGCRPSMALLPAVLTLQAWRRGTDLLVVLRRDSGRLAGLAVPILFYAPIAIVNQGQVVDSTPGEIGIILKLQKMVMALGTAAQNLLVPLELMPIYPYREGAGLVEFLPGIAALAGILWLGAVLYRRGERRWLVYLLLAAVLWAPFSQIVDLPRMTADTYLYGTMIWVIALGVSASARLMDGRRRKLALGGIGIVLVTGLSISTHGQVARWKSLKTLWKPVQQRDPRLWKPYVMLGHYYRDQGDWKRAAAVLTEGYPYMKQGHFIPDFMPEVLSRAGHPRRAADVALTAIKRHRRVEDDHYQALLGTLAGNNIPMGQDPEVIATVEKAVEVYTSNENWMEIRSNRAALARYFMNQGRPDLARRFIPPGNQRSGP
jgi:uncharacterized metal-binding protein